MLVLSDLYDCELQLEQVKHLRKTWGQEEEAEGGREGHFVGAAADKRHQDRMQLCCSWARVRSHTQEVHQQRTGYRRPCRRCRA